MLYFKRLIQIPKLPDVRAQRDGERWDDFSAESQLPPGMSKTSSLPNSSIISKNMEKLVDY